MEGELQIPDHAAADVGACFGLPMAPSFTIAPMSRSAISVTRLTCHVVPGTEQVVALPPEDSYFLMLYLCDVVHCDIRADLSREPARNYRSGSVCLVDLAEGASIALQTSLEALAFVIPKSIFGEMKAGFMLDSQVSSLRCVRAAPDGVIAGLGTALMPIFEHAVTEASSSTDHIMIALCAHLLHVYADACEKSGAMHHKLGPKRLH